VSHGNLQTVKAPALQPRDSPLGLAQDVNRTLGDAHPPLNVLTNGAAFLTTLDEKPIGIS
jgi:hypothetical protein